MNFTKKIKKSKIEYKILLLVYNKLEDWIILAKKIKMKL